MPRLSPVLLTTVVILSLLVPLAHAQQQPRMDPNEMMRMMQDPAAMQKMAAQAQAAETCMKGIKQSDLEALQRKAQEASAEIERLCKAGKRDEALAKGMSMAREMQTNATVKKLRECTKDLSETMQRMMPMSIPDFDDEEPTKEDICS